MCSASQPEPITVECPPEVPDADPEEEYERLPVYVERLGILDEAEAEAEAADGWIKFEEETAATAPVVTDSGGGDVEFGNFEGGFGGSDSFGAAPSPRLAASDVELIKSAMAALDIQPPPWIRKMQHLQAGARRGTAALSLTLPPSSSPSARRGMRVAQAVQRAQTAVAAACGEEAPPETPLGAASEVHFAHRAHELLPHANLSRGTLAAASPFAAASAAAGSSAAECAGLAASGPAANLAGLPARRKKVTGRELAAERRREREVRRAAAAAAAR